MTDNAELPSSLKKEIQGDWSVFKGTHYHLLYAAWLLVRKNALEVSFYAGNDLTAKLITPPQEIKTTDTLGVRTSSDHMKDIWIQLKNDDNLWTLNRILKADGDKNKLLPTFIINALYSKSQGREWQTILVSPKGVAADDFRVFINTLERYESSPGTLNPPKYYAEYSKKISEAYLGWKEYCKGRTHFSLSMEQIKKVALSIFESLADSPALPTKELQDELEVELAYRLIDRQRTKEVGQKILGELLRITDKRPKHPHPLTLTEIGNSIGESLQREDLVYSDPIRACDIQIERYCPKNWEASKYAPRHQVQDRLEEFLFQRQTLFVLTGDSGTGKSWALADWATNSLKGKIRIWLSRTSLTKRPSLSAIVYEASKQWASPASTEQEIFRMMHAASKTIAGGSFVLILDDLEPPQEPSNFATYLEDLCREAENHRVKLVISVRSGVWGRLLRNAKQIIPYLYENSDKYTNADATSSVSFKLSNANDRDLANILALRIPQTSFLQDTLRQLMHPNFAVLRNFYLLDLFISQHRSALTRGQVPRATVDSLLDRDIEHKLQSAATQIDCEYIEIRTAVQDGLVPLIWSHRKMGIEVKNVLSVLQSYVGNVQRAAFWALRKEDIISISAPNGSGQEIITWSNTQVGARLTAKWLARRIAGGSNVLEEMVPGFDDEPMHALLRDHDGLPASDATTLAWLAVSGNQEWIEAVSGGIAQRTEQPRKILAMLTAWSSERGPMIVSAMDALATLLPLSSAAREWAATLFLDASPNVSIVGTCAMMAAFEYMPRWVARIVRLRVGWLLNSKMGQEWPVESRATMFARAIQPFSNIKSPDAAQTAKSVLAWIDNCAVAVPTNTWSLSSEFRRQVHLIQGNLAVYDGSVRSSVLTRLEHPQPEQRLTASIELAQLLMNQEHKHEEVLETVLRHLGKENDENVVMNLLRALIGYVNEIPDELISLLPRFCLDQYNVYGVVLILLSKLARLRPDEVRPLLPISLSSIPATERTILTELLLVAWWCYAEERPTDSDAKAILEIHCIPSYSDVPPALRVIATRSAAVAQLALISFRQPMLSDALKHQQYVFYPRALESNKGFLYIFWDRLCRRANPKAISESPQSVLLVERLCEAAREYKSHETHPSEEPFFSWQWQLANNTVDWLCELIPHVSNPLEVLQKLPNDWPALRACTVLIEAGSCSHDVINYGRRVASENLPNGTFVDDRDRFLSLLPSKNRDALPGLHFLDRTAERQPTDLLNLLPNFLDQNDIIKRIWQWSFQSSHWRTVLLSRVYRIGFSTQPLSLLRCKQICEQMLTALSDLPYSASAEETLNLYRTFHQFCINQDQQIEPSDFYIDKSKLCDRNSFCLDILVRSSNRDEVINNEWFDAIFSKRIGWLEDFHDHIIGGNVTTTISFEYRGPRICYLWPEFRIAIAIASNKNLGRDFTPTWHQNWEEIHALIRQSVSLENSNSHDPKIRASIISDLEAQERKTPHHVSLYLLQEYLGFVLTHAQDWERARTVLMKYLSHSELSAVDIANAKYNLACALVGLGRIDEAKAILSEVTPSLMMSREAVEDDLDFVSVRSEEWFQYLIRQLPTKSERRMQRIESEQKAIISTYERRFGLIPDEIRTEIESQTKMPQLVSWHSTIATTGSAEIPQRMKESPGMVIMICDPSDQDEPEADMTNSELRETE